MNYTVRSTCRLCRSTHLRLALPLAPIPIASPNFHVPEVKRSDPLYTEAVPLNLHLCENCKLIQLLLIPNPNLLYGNYVYRTAMSAGLGEHFAATAGMLVRRFNLSKGSNVLEIGSNDGTMLRQFSAMGLRAIGVDPASGDTHGMIAAPFGMKVASHIGYADLVIANNVLANIDELDDVILGVKHLIGSHGVFVFETQYGEDVIRKNLLDTVYHEHLSYFTVSPLVRFLAVHGLRVFDVEHIPTKGGSIRVYVRDWNVIEPWQHGSYHAQNRIEDAVIAEEAGGTYDLATFAKWGQRIGFIRESLSQIEGNIAGYGVSVGTTTLLAQLGLSDRIKVLFDDDPNKGDELIGPGYAIPIGRPGHVYDVRPDIVVIFAWRYADQIMARHPDFKGKWIVPLPDLRIL